MFVKLQLLGQDVIFLDCKTVQDLRYWSKLLNSMLHIGYPNISTSLPSLSNVEVALRLCSYCRQLDGTLTSSEKKTQFEDR